MRPLFIMSLLFLSAFSFAQKRKKTEPVFYVYDANWKPCDMDAAHYLVVDEDTDDTTYRSSIYHFKGPLIAIETYRDKDKTIPHGFFAWYDQEGRMDSSGYSFYGKKNDHWNYYTDTFSVYLYEKYNSGQLIERKDSSVLNDETRKNLATGMLPGDKEATFKGGDKAWMKYLLNTYQYPERAFALGIHGTIRVSFVVNSDGSIYNIQLRRSVEYSLDTEALRLITLSPRWEPARQSDRPVKAYRIQPITF